jgi:predicted HicB family RNase H-like nuclease
MTIRIEPRLYERVAGWAQHEGQSLNAMTLELLEATLDAWDSVEAADTEAAAK